MVGLHICNVNGPTPSVAQTPMETRVERMKRLTSPVNSTRAPALERPISNDAPGIGRVSENDADHVSPMLLLAPKRDTHALYPKFAGVAQGRNHIDAPIVI